MTPASRISLEDEDRADLAPDKTKSVRRDLIRTIGADGYLGVGWPEELGGRGGGLGEQLILVEEAEAAGAPLPLMSLLTVGPTLVTFGTPTQRERYLPGIL